MKPKRDEDSELCTDLHPDDGVPPHVLAKRHQRTGSAKSGRHRLAQLCKQVRIALGEALVCDISDPVIQDLEIVSVEPATGSTVLQVILKSPDPRAEAIEGVYQRLEPVSGRLRAAVACAIHRKRVPQLRFRVIA